MPDFDSIELKYHWDLVDAHMGDKTILSPMIEYRGQQLFRVALKMSLEKATLLFLATHCNMVGIKVVDVRVHEEISSMKLTKRKEDEIECIQLWQQDISHLDQHGFTFHIYITCIVNGYQILPISSSLAADNLLSNPDWADLEIVTGGRKFKVHQFILAARSPVFLTLFDLVKKCGTEIPTLEIEYVDAATMEQFLRFLYTGELVGSINSSQLSQLAATYQVETLEALCQVASHTITQGQMELLSLARLNPEGETSSMEIRYKKLFK